MSFEENHTIKTRLNEINEKINELMEEKKALEHTLPNEKSVPPVYLVYDSTIYSEKYHPLLFKDIDLALEYIQRNKHNPNLEWKEIGVIYELFVY